MKKYEIKSNQLVISIPSAMLIVAVMMMPLSSSTIAGTQVDEAMQAINPEIAEPFSIDEAKVKANGIDIFRGQHIVLYTDLRDDGRSKDLVKAFDAAVPKWSQVFNIDVAKTKPWKVRAFLIASPADLSRFQTSDLIPNVPSFAAGYQNNHNVWLFSQPGNYYTRHLLLHEGTHAFMQWFTGGYGAPWYSEGSAEMVGLHRWKNSQLTLRYRLQDRSEASDWGRVKIVRRDRMADNTLSLDEVLMIPANAFRDVRFYAWSWAGCEFFRRHPLTKDIFPQLINHTRLDGTGFNAKFRDLLQQSNVDWKRLQDDWVLFINEIEYGYAIERGAISKAQSMGENRFSVAADLGWQTTGIQVKRGQRWDLSASGRYELGALDIQTKSSDSTETKRYKLTSSPGGVTIQYYRGRPLGEFQVGIYHPDGEDANQRTAGLTKFQSVGIGKTIEAHHDGVLCVRVNESPAKLHDNSGSLDVTMKRTKN